MPVGGGFGVVVPGGPGVIVRSAPSVIVRIRPGMVVGRTPGCPAGSAIVRMFIAGLTMLMRFFIAGIILFVGMMEPPPQDVNANATAAMASRYLFIVQMFFTSKE